MVIFPGGRAVIGRPLQAVPPESTEIRAVWASRETRACAFVLPFLLKFPNLDAPIMTIRENR